MERLACTLYRALPGFESSGIGVGWERYIEDSTHFIGMTGFGDSGPAEALYAHFGITNDAIVLRAREVLAS